MKHITVFAFDRNEASQLRTTRALQSTGAKILSLSFARPNMTQTPGDWTEIDLGSIKNGLGFGRLASLITASARIFRRRRSFAQTDIIVARNLDMAALAVFFRWVTKTRAPLLYQCLDIHPVFTGTGLRARFACWIERRVLARVDRVIISSPRFQTEHFQGPQRPRGDIHLFENRIWWGATQPPRPDKTTSIGTGPLRLGWVGSLRCPGTFGILCKAADILGPDVQIILRGTVHHHALPEFRRQVDLRQNMSYEGPYEYPQGLADAYSDLDLAWGQELWSRGGNTDWLLPNRIYEAGYFGCPLIAVRGSETSNRIRDDRAGLVLNHPDARLLADLLRNITREELATIRQRLLNRKISDFCASPDDITAMLTLSPKISTAGAIIAQPA